MSLISPESLDFVQHLKYAVVKGWVWPGGSALTLLTSPNDSQDRRSKWGCQTGSPLGPMDPLHCPLVSDPANDREPTRLDVKLFPGKPRKYFVFQSAGIIRPTFVVSVLSWNSTGEIGRIGRHRAETHRYFNIRVFGPMPPDASDFPGGIPALGLSECVSCNFHAFFSCK